MVNDQRVVVIVQNQPFKNFFVEDKVFELIKFTKLVNEYPHPLLYHHEEKVIIEFKSLWEKLKHANENVLVPAPDQLDDELFCPVFVHLLPFVLEEG